MVSILFPTFLKVLTLVQSIPMFQTSSALHPSFSISNKVSNPVANALASSTELPAVPVVPLEVALTDMGTQLKFSGQVEQGMNEVRCVRLQGLTTL